MNIWLISTEHLERQLLFRDDSDFAEAMNKIAILSHTLKLDIHAFILMSNHIHVILAGNKIDEAREFINKFKTMHSRYIFLKYGVRELMRRNRVNIQEVPLSGESYERAVAYVQMNSVSANICCHPSGYPWGTGNTFFNNSAESGRMIGTFSERGRMKILHSKIIIPENWIAGESGFILPRSFVNVEFVQSVFRTPMRMNHFLQSSSKARKLANSGEGAR